jgi:hypothetical protein
MVVVKLTQVNTVERALHYAGGCIPKNATYETPYAQPKKFTGEIVFEDVVMSYRPGMPSVLKGVYAPVRAKRPL